MRRSLALFLFSFLGATACTQNPLTISYATSEKEIDGRSDDWEMIGAQSFTLKNPLLADPKFDNQVQVKFEWNEQYLFGFAEIRDQNLIKLRYGNDNPSLYLGDALEIYIDPLNDSGSRMDVNDYQFLMDVGEERAIFKGDRHLADSMWRAPKEVGTATVAFQFKTTFVGTLNREGDRDSIWQVEFALPWAALGKIVGQDSLFRLDVCLNDMDSIIDLAPIPEGVSIPPFSYGSWEGSNDFGFPDRWRVCRLIGGPGFWLQFERQHLRLWLPLLSVLIVSFLLIVLVLQRKINRLRQVPVRAEMGETAFAHLLQPTLIDLESTPNTPIFDRLRTFVTQRLHDDLSPDDLARHVHISLRQLQRIFREELDTTPNTFILLIKMEKAAELLRLGKANVSEVAYELGFSDPGYFSKVFRKYFGVAPKDFT